MRLEERDRPSGLAFRDGQRRPAVLRRTIDRRAVVQRAAPRRRGRSASARPRPINLGAFSSTSRAASTSSRARSPSPDRPPRLSPTTVAPRRRGRQPFSSPDRPPRRCPAAAWPFSLAVIRRSLSPGRPPRLCPAAAAASTRPFLQAKNSGVRAVLVRPIDLRAFLQQQPRRVDVALLAGDEQRRRTVLFRPVDLRAVVQQQPRRVDVAVRAGDIQRRPTVLHSPDRPPRLCPAAAAHASTWPFWQAMNSGARPCFVRPVDLRAFLQQQPRRVDLAFLAGDQYSGVAPLSPGRPPRLSPATVAPRRRLRSAGDEQRRRTVLPRPPDRPPRRCPAAAAPRRRGPARAGDAGRLFRPIDLRAVVQQPRRSTTRRQDGVAQVLIRPTCRLSASAPASSGDVRRRRSPSPFRPVDLRASVQQQPRRVDLAIIAAAYSGVAAPYSPDRPHAPSVQQPPRGVDVALLALVVREASLPSSARRLRAIVHNRSRAVDVAVVAGDVQRRRTVLVRPVDVPPFVQQQPRRVDVALLAGDVQRRRAVLIRPIDLRAVVPAAARVAVAAGSTMNSGVRPFLCARGPPRLCPAAAPSAARWTFVAVDVQSAWTVLIRPIDLRPCPAESAVRSSLAIAQWRRTIRRSSSGRCVHSDMR